MNKVITKEITEIVVSEHIKNSNKVENTSKIVDFSDASSKSFNDLSFNHSVFDSLFDSVVIINTDTTIKLVNQTTIQLTGFSEEELIGESIEILSKNKRSFNKIIDRFLSRNNYISEFNTYCRRRDGSSFPVSFSASKIFDSQSKAYNIVCVVRDTTKRKRLEAESRVISQIIHGVTSTSNLDELLQLAHKSIGQILYAENCFVALYDEKTEMFNMQFFIDKYDTTPPPFKLGKNLTTYVYRKGKGMLMNADVIAQLTQQGELESAGTDSPIWLGVPLRTPKGIIGVLVVQHYEDKDAYNQQDLKFLSSIGDQIALAIERKQAENALRESERKISTLMSNLPGMAYRCLNDNKWTLNFVSDGCFNLTGYDPSNLIDNNGITFSDLIHPDDRDEVWDKVQVAVIEKKPFQLTYRIKTAKGEEKWVWEQGQSIYGNDGKLSALEGFIIDITDRIKAEKDLRKSQERFHLVTRATNDAIWDWDLVTNQLWWNEGFQKLFGYLADEVGSILESWTIRVHPDDLERVTHGLYLFIENGQQNWSDEYRFRRADGSYAVVIDRGYVVYDDNRKPIRMLGSMMDVTERKLLEEQLTHQTLHDPLTKLANRVLFGNRVEHALTKIKRNKNSIAVLFLDLDNFKAVNDSLGHAGGDALLVLVTNRLRICLRNTDTAARLSGDEFAILLEDIKQTDEAVILAERIKESFNVPFSIAGKEIFVGVSIGIAMSTKDPISSEKLLCNADIAMYTAKSQGKGRHITFEEKMHEALMERLEIETDLRRAITDEEFVLHYQPIIDLQTQCITGMEALVRWNHPLHGLIHPNKFIPVAEETNLIEPLGEWVLKEVCKQAQIWQKQYGGESELFITINLSIKQFQQKDLVDTISSILSKTGLCPKCLILEITESFMLQNTEETIGKLNELKNLGVRLAIDDFGTGYSSLSYLQRLPIDILKIDKSFIDQISYGNEGATVAKAIITMSDSLNLKAIAEGIEHPEQIEVLRNLGCILGQGFYFTKPLSKKDMDEYLFKQAKIKNNLFTLNH
jgi:diguanylate cyclase (GGDEF)-like protein/PAS domain S-box-containing protein